MQFQFVILDECSQITEPASLLPLLRFSPRFLCAVGDPLQLPPVVVDVPAPAGKAGIQRALFVRLRDMGHAPLPLRTQFRCHPALSAVPNACFYGGLLLDGVAAAERAPLLPSLPALSFLDVRKGSESRMAGGSCENEEEAAVAAAMVRHLVASGIARGDIGVITFYRAQARRAPPLSCTQQHS